MAEKYDAFARTVFARNLSHIGEGFEATIGIDRFFYFAGKISTQLHEQIHRKNIGWITDVGVLEVEYSHFLPILGRVVYLAAFFHFFGLLTTRRIVIIQSVGSSGIVRVSTMLGRSASIGSCIFCFGCTPLGCCSRS